MARCYAAEGCGNSVLNWLNCEAPTHGFPDDEKFRSVHGSVSRVRRLSGAGGHTIPEGTNIGLIIYVLHRDPDAFPRPEEFDPDRFLPENSASRHPFAFIPFSAGSRNCIGQKFASMEIKIILGHVLRSFSLQSVDPRDKLLMTVDTVLRTANGLKIKFIPRVS
ncbi:cytochrome P450 4V2 [Ixodes scapularis]